MKRIAQFFSFGKSERSSSAQAKPEAKVKGGQIEEEKLGKMQQLESKLQKYRAKYRKQREFYIEEKKKNEECNAVRDDNQHKIQVLNRQIDEKTQACRELEERIRSTRAKTQDIYDEISKFPKKGELGKDLGSMQVSYSSLQLENLKEKLQAKLNRIEELEKELLLQAQKSNGLLKEIALIKSQL